jgi:hypothetical protein
VDSGSNSQCCVDEAILTFIWVSFTGNRSTPSKLLHHSVAGESGDAAIDITPLSAALGAEVPYSTAEALSGVALIAAATVSIPSLAKQVRSSLYLL